MNHSHGKSKLTLKGVGVNDKPSEAEMEKREPRDPLLELLESAKISTITEESQKEEMTSTKKTHPELFNV